MKTWITTIMRGILCWFKHSVTCCFPYYSLSTLTLVWDIAAPPVPPTCQTVRRERKSWSCWRKRLTGDSLSPLDDLPPQASTMSSPGMTFTTRPAWEVVHNGMHSTALCCDQIASFYVSSCISLLSHQCSFRPLSSKSEAILMIIWTDQVFCSWWLPLLTINLLTIFLIDYFAY